MCVVFVCCVATAGLPVGCSGEVPPAPVAVTPGATISSPEELKALVDQRVQEELNRIKNSGPRAPAPLTANDSSPNNPFKRFANRNTQVALARGPLSKSEREKWASALTLLSSKNDDDDWSLEYVVNSESPDEALVEQRLRELEAAQAVAMRMRILTEIRIRGVLTSEQRKVLGSLQLEAQQ